MVLDLNKLSDKLALAGHDNVLVTSMASDLVNADTAAEFADAFTAKVMETHGDAGASTRNYATVYSAFKEALKFVDGKKQFKTLGDKLRSILETKNRGVFGSVFAELDASAKKRGYYRYDIEAHPANRKDRAVRLVVTIVLGEDGGIDANATWKGIEDNANTVMKEAENMGTIDLETIDALARSFFTAAQKLTNACGNTYQSSVSSMLRSLFH